MKEFHSAVKECRRTDSGFAVVLEATAFFPEEGGQYSDRGTLDGVRVTDVKEESGVIYHMTEGALPVGATVYGVIDFDERFEKMQCHTAEHILSGLFHKHYGVNNVGFHLGAEDVTLDISTPLSWDDLMKIEELANGAVFENIAVEAVYPAPDELPTLEYRSKLDLTENVRIINIKGYDSCACCAPHVSYTGEIGSIKILDAQKLRGGMRIHFTAGKRAFLVYRKMYENLAEISHALSVPRLECSGGVGKLLSDLEVLKNDYKNARTACFEREAELIAPTDKNVVLFYPDTTQDELRMLANAARERVSGMLVLLSGKEGEYKYIITSKSTDLKENIKKINAALCGRGGGNSLMAQGGFSTTLAKIKEYFI